MSNEKQTAVEWLVEQIIKEKGLVDLDIQAAKEMEKAQIVKANNNGCGSMMCMIDSKRDGEQYYEKTYGGNK